jgi:ribose transport system permease protein
MPSKVHKLSETQSLRHFDWRQYIAYIAFVVVFIFFAATLSSDGFLTVNNLLNIIRQTAIIAIVGVAVTFVISAAEIDLSVGAIAGLSSLNAAFAVQHGYGLVGGFVAGLATGLVIGVINGLLVTRVAIPSFLVTLGMMGICRGVAMWVSETAPIPILDKNFNFMFGSGDIGQIPVLLIWALLIAIVGHVLLRKTAFGRQTLAVGGNRNAARFSGVNITKLKLLIFIMSGMMAGFAGILYAGRMQTGRYTFGDGDELSVIAAVILGGTSLFGGVGTVVGTVVGAVMIGTINNGLIIMGLDVSQQMIVKGVIIILAVAFGRKTMSN